MATEFKTVLDHGTYILNALVRTDSPTVELFLVAEREGEEVVISDNGDVVVHTLKLAKPVADVDAFRLAYMDWLGAGGKEELEGVLNPVSAFNQTTPIVTEGAPVEEKTVEVVEVAEPVAKKAPAKPRAKAKPKPKSSPAE